MKKRIFVCFLIFITCLFYFSIPGTVFGQSPAEMVIANYKETLLREDIRPLLPDVLRAFDTFEGNLIPLSIKIYLDKPIFLRKVDPNIDEFIARLYVDDDLRTLFADGQFYNVLKNSDEIAKLKDWLLPEPMELKYVSGNSQEGLINTRLLDALVVQVRDQHDKPIAGIQVNFSVPKGNGMLSDKTAMTDQMGKASVTLTLGSEAGENSVVASVAGTSLTQTFTATAIAVDESPKPTTPSIVSGTDEAIDADVNGDGVVNIIDLSIVLAFIGNPDRSMEAIDEDVDADINEDEVVNYEDLILILSVLEPAAAAPSVHALVKIGVSAADVRVLLTQAKALPEGYPSRPCLSAWYCWTGAAFGNLNGGTRCSETDGTLGELSEPF